MMAIEGSTGECSTTTLSGKEAGHSPSNQERTVFNYFLLIKLFHNEQEVVWETFFTTKALNVVKSTVTGKSGLAISAF